MIEKVILCPERVRKISAIADRLVYNSEVLILGGTSYRRKAK